MKILFKYPTRQRPEVFKSVLKKYYDNLSGQHDCQFVITLDSDDASMNNDAMKSFLMQQPGLTYHYGSNKSKIEAVNADLKGVKFDVLVLVSDDMHPEVFGFDDIILSDMKRFYPECDGVLHYNDGRVGKTLNTLSIMGSAFYHKFGYVYHPDYVSLWCDNEFQLVSEGSGKATYIDKVVIRHVWEKYLHDDLHRKNDRWYNRDKQVFEARKMAGFPIASINPTALPKFITPQRAPKPIVINQSQTTIIPTRPIRSIRSIPVRPAYRLPKSK